MVTYSQPFFEPQSSPSPYDAVVSSTLASHGDSCQDHDREDPGNTVISDSGEIPDTRNSGSTAVSFQEFRITSATVFSPPTSVVKMRTAVNSLRMSFTVHSGLQPSTGCPASSTNSVPLTLSPLVLLAWHTVFRGDT